MTAALESRPVSKSSIFADPRAAFAIATLCTLLWASAVPGVKVGFELFGILPSDVPSLLAFAGVRFAVAGLLLLGYCLLTRRAIALTPPLLGGVLLLGLLSTGVQYLFFYIGLAHSTGVKVSIMTSTGTFFSVLLAHFIYTDDKLTLRRALGCIAGFAGVIAVNFASSGLDISFTLMGEGFIVIAALLFTLAAIYGKGLSQRMDVTVMTGWQLFLGGAVLAAGGFATGGRLGAVGWEALVLLGYLCALSATAFTLWSQLLKHNPVGSIAVFNFLVPIFGTLLSGAILGESIFEWRNLVALALVSVGIYLVTATGRAEVRTPAAP